MRNGTLSYFNIIVSDPKSGLRVQSAPLGPDTSRNVTHESWCFPVTPINHSSSPTLSTGSWGFCAQQREKEKVLMVDSKALRNGGPHPFKSSSSVQRPSKEPLKLGAKRVPMALQPHSRSYLLSTCFWQSSSGSVH